jgi:hypothetical protein
VLLQVGVFDEAAVCGDAHRAALIFSRMRMAEVADYLVVAAYAGTIVGKPHLVIRCLLAGKGGATGGRVVSNIFHKE